MDSKCCLGPERARLFLSHQSKFHGYPKPRPYHQGQIMWHFPPTPKQLGATGCVFVTGVALIAVGTHLSYANVAPQQARTEARRQFLKDYLRKKLDKEW
ncbi:uncharacterized protein [Typha angustifolia]|uniref:uncharacterized protein n=1 Tax=Typha angustifolia TaxID=59011 RepID=UPI003C2F02C3